MDWALGWKVSEHVDPVMTTISGGPWMHERQKYKTLALHNVKFTLLPAQLRISVAKRFGSGLS